MANDTMPIRIPVSMGAQQAEQDATRVVTSLQRIGSGILQTAQDADSGSRSMAAMAREHEQLTAQQQKQVTKVDELRKAYAEASQAKELDVDALGKLARQLSTAETQLERMDRALGDNELAQYTQGVRAVDDQIQRLTDTMQMETAALAGAENVEKRAAVQHERTAEIVRLKAQRLEEVRRATDAYTQAGGNNSRTVEGLNKLNDKYAAELGRANAELDRQAKALGGVSAAQEDVKKATEDALRVQDEQINAFAKLAREGVDRVSASFLQFGADAFEAGRNVEAMEGTFDRTFKASADSARQWSVQIADSLGASEYRVRDMMAQWAVMFEGMQMGLQDQTRMIEGLTSAAYDFAAQYDTEVGTALEKLKSGLTGSSLPLREFGVIINETMVKTYAWSNGIAQQGKELTEQEKVLARYGLIMEQTAGAQGAWNAEAETTVGQMRSNEERIDKLKSKIGLTLLPVIGELLGMVEPLVKWLANMDETGLKIIVTVGAAVAAIGPLLQILANLTLVIKGIQALQAAGGITRMASLISGPMSLAIGKWVLLLLGVAAAIALIVWAWDRLRGSTNNIQNDVQQQANGIMQMQGRVGNNARGTNNWRGGPTWVGEEGPEIVDLPAGARVYPADQSRRMAGSNTYNFTVDFERVRDVTRLIDTAKNAERLARQY